MDCDKEKHEDTKEVIRNHISKKDRKYNGQKKKDKQPSKKKHYTENKRSDNTNSTKNRGLRNGRQFLLYMCLPSCHSCYKPDNKSWMWRKGHNHGLSKPMNTKTSRKTRFLHKAEMVSNCCLASINVREKRRGNQDWIIQKNWQHWGKITQDEDKHNKGN